MHLILSRGLYDQNGIQYIDNSFTVMKIPGLNADVFGRPIRWSRGENPAGFSDHFPLFARFRTVDKNAKDRWMPLNQPSRMESGPGTPIRVETSTVDLFDSAVSYPDLPDGTNIRDGSFDGRVFLVEAPATVNEKGHVQITLGGAVYDVFTHNQDLRPLLREAARTSGHLRFYGELGTYRGRWQFVLHGKEWFPESAAN
jgi:hypothetical protein